MVHGATATMTVSSVPLLLQMISDRAKYFFFFPVIPNG